MNNRQFLYSIFILFVLILISSCESRIKDSYFIGTWQFTEKITSDGLTYNTIRTLILTRNTYEEVYIIERENKGSILAIIGTKGDLILSHSSLTFILKELGTCIKDASERCSENVQWFGEDTQYWTDNISYFKTEVRGDFTASEAILHLKRDLNKDGDFGDTGEDVEFQRVNPGNQ